MIQKRKSGIYEGQVFHERLMPKHHSFRYRVFMMYLDTDEVDDLCSIHRFWGRSKFSLARFKRNDFFGNPQQSVSHEIKTLVQNELGFTPSGPVRILANLRYFGYIMNPLITYYCFDKNENLEAIVAQVNNTPWNETHPYVLDCRQQPKNQSHRFEKVFTVSPFNPINMVYRWESNMPSEQLNIHIENTQQDERVFHAQLSLERTEISKKALTRCLIVYPFFTVKVITAIYWQALKLFIKGIPFLGKNFIASPSAK